MPFTKSRESGLTLAPPPAGLPADPAELARTLAAERDPPRRAQLLGALVAQDSPEAAQALASLLAEAEAAIRACGVEGLRQIAPAHSRPVLAALLADSSPEIRIRTLDAVPRAPDPEIEGWMIALLDAEHHGNVCATALDLLAEIGTPAALPAIRAARLRFANEPFIAFAADHAITQITEG